MAQRGTKPKPNRARDVQNPLWKAMEERVYRWLLDQGKHVQDKRDEHTYYDFIVGSAWTLDVKCDTRAHESGCVAWEQLVEDLSKDGPEAFQPGWGMHHGLSYVVYVLLQEPHEGPQQVVVINAQKLRSAILTEGESANCKPFITNGSDRRATGYVVSLDWLDSQHLIIQRGEV